MAKEKQVKVRIDAPAAGYKYYLYANRFAVQKIDEYLLLSFGLVNNRIPLSELSALIAIEELQRCRAGNMAYIDQLTETGVVSEDLGAWTPSFSSKDVSVINILSLTRTGDIAETLLMNVSSRYVWEASQRNSSSVVPVIPDAFGLVRSPVGLQISMLLEIYKLLPSAKG